jgi:hypothetical protein
LPLPNSEEGSGEKFRKAELNEMFQKMSQDIRLDVYGFCPEISHLGFHSSPFSS